MSFDVLAPHYGWMEKVLAGPRLQRVRTAWIGELAGCRRLLVAGVGHGPDLAAVLQAHPQLHVTCLDASAGMLHRAQDRVQRVGADLTRLVFIHAELPDWRAPEPFDAIATHFFLDCFPPETLAAVIATLSAAAAPDARWIISDFTVPEHGWRRWRARAIHALMYAFFRVTTRLPARRYTNPDPFLAQAGFHLSGRRTFEWGLLQADFWQRGGRSL
jgi:ubiquinone/menaquinone biosynthesis C-methylase UbiE